MIEVDGGIHLMGDNPEYDRFRTHELEAMGLKVIRFRNEEVLGDIPRVLVEIRKHLTPGPSPKGEGNHPLLHEEKGRG